MSMDFIPCYKELNMSWQNDLSKRLSVGATYNIDKTKVILLESPRGVSGYGGHGGAIFVRCKVIEDGGRWEKGTTQRLNAEFLR